jgi:DNA-binding transcriptional ArsR family regulator
VVDKVFAALASESRRQILAYLSDDGLTAGEIAARFQMSKPAISKHLQLLEAADLVTSEKRGQFVWYSLSRDNLVEAVAKFMQMVGATAVVTEEPRLPGISPPVERRSASRIDRPPNRA